MPLAAFIWDDGLITDAIVLSVARQHGLPMSFALSCGVYGDTPTPNDPRGARYGWRVARRTLPSYAPHDVWNHTYTHADLSTLSPAAAREEVVRNRQELESLFERPVPGLVYPYGSHTEESRGVIASAGAAYARVGGRGPMGADPLAFTPTTAWDAADASEVLRGARRSSSPVVIRGHSYELTSDEDYRRLDQLCRLLARLGFDVVSLSDLCRVHYGPVAGPTSGV